MTILYGSPPNGSNSRHKTADVMDEDEKEEAGQEPKGWKERLFSNYGLQDGAKSTNDRLNDDLPLPGN